MYLYGDAWMMDPWIKGSREEGECCCVQRRIKDCSNRFGQSGEQGAPTLYIGAPTHASNLKKNWEKIQYGMGPTAKKVLDDLIRETTSDRRTEWMPYRVLLNFDESIDNDERHI